MAAIADLPETPSSEPLAPNSADSNILLISGLPRDILACILAFLDGVCISYLWTTGNGRFMSLLRAATTSFSARAYSRVFWVPSVMSCLTELTSIRVTTAKFIWRGKTKNMRRLDLTTFPKSLQDLQLYLPVPEASLKSFVEGKQALAEFLPHLRTLCLSDCGDSDDVLGNLLLAGLPQTLNRLELPYPLVFRLRDFSLIPTSITHLSLEGPQTTTDKAGGRVVNFVPPPHLQTLAYRAAATIYPPAFYENLPDSLTSLSLTGHELDPSQAALIPRQLVSLRLSFTFKDILSCIKALPRNLDHLNLDERSYSTSVTIDMIAALPRTLNSVEWNTASSLSFAAALPVLPPTIQSIAMKCFFRGSYSVPSWAEASQWVDRWPKTLRFVKELVWPCSPNTSDYFTIPSSLSDVHISTFGLFSLRLSPLQLQHLPNHMTSLKIKNCSNVPFNSLVFLKNLILLKHLELSQIQEPFLSSGDLWTLPIPPLLETLVIRGTLRFADEFEPTENFFSLSLDDSYDVIPAPTPSSVEQKKLVRRLSLSGLPDSMHRISVTSATVHVGFLLTTLPQSLERLEVDRITEPFKDVYKSNIRLQTQASVRFSNLTWERNYTRD